MNESISSVGFAVAGGEVTGTIAGFSLRADQVPRETAALHLADGPGRVARKEGAVSFWMRREEEGGRREVLWAAGEDPEG